MADGAELTLGMLVEHPKWGLGKIVHLTAPHLYVVFRDLSDRKAKRFTRGNNPLVPRPGLRDPILDNLPPLVFEGSDLVLPVERLPVSQAIEAFRVRFPLGFQDPAYLGDRTTGERNYKVAAHEAWVELLGGEKLRELLDAGEIEAVRERAKRVLGMINLLSQYELMALLDGLADDSAASRFFDMLERLLRAEGDLEPAFQAFLDACEALPRKKGRVFSWPVVTVLPFLALPQAHMLLKPEMTKAAALRLGFDLQYDPTPNWRTYSRLLELARIYFEELASLAPRDRIDVQSFLFVAAGGYDRPD